MSQEIIVQDDELAILTPKKAFSLGHVIITTIQEYRILEEVPPSTLARMFQISNKLSSVLFEQLGCHGTNILIQNGLGAGQTNPRFSINVIPRFEKDNLKLEWTPTPAEPEKLQNAQTKFLDLDKEENEKKYLEAQKAKAEETKKLQVIKSSDEKKKRNYFVRSLEKVA
jgi:histidine triad (HIT) family protein